MHWRRPSSMEKLADRLYRRMLAGRGRTPQSAVSLSTAELLYYYWKRGSGPWLRGLFWRWRFKKCDGRLFVGKKLNLLFPGRIALGRSVYLGDYSYINGLARDEMVLGNNVTIREFAWIQASSSPDDLGKGLRIGDNTYIGPRCILGAGGGITIGSNVTMGAGVDILAENHEFRDPNRLIRLQGVTREGIVIADDVWIGNRVTILDGVRVGRGAVLGAAAVVTRDVAPNHIVAGNPARVLGVRGDESCEA